MMAVPAVRIASRAGAKALFIDNVSPQTRLLEKRRQVFEIEEALEAQKEDFARREEAFRRREEGLKKKDLELTEAFIRFNQVLVENDAKKTRAEKKTAEEAVATVKKEKDVEETTKQLQELRAEVTDLHNQKQQLEVYHKYLDVFHRDYPEQFTEINSILERHRTLVAWKERRANEKNVLTEQIEDQRKALTRLQKAASTQVLTSENLLTKMKERLETIHEHAEALQQGAEDATVSKGRSILELGQIFQCVQNLHQRCIASDGGKVIKHAIADGEVLGFNDFDGVLADGGSSRAERRAAAIAHLTAVDEAEEAGTPAPAHAAPAKMPTKKEIEGMEASTLRNRLADAVALLHVVGSYITDFEDIVTAHPAWVTEQKRISAERQAALAAEASRLAAARAAKLGGAPKSPKAAKSGAGSPVSSAHLLSNNNSKSNTSPLRIAGNKSPSAQERMTSTRKDLHASALNNNSSTFSNSSTLMPSQTASQIEAAHVGLRGVYVVKGAVIDPAALAKFAAAQAANASGLAGTSGGGPMKRSLGGTNASSLASTNSSRRLPAASPLKTVAMMAKSFAKPHS